MQYPYNYVFAFLTTKIPILCQIFRRQQRYLMPLILTIFMTEFMRGVKLSSVFAKKYYRSYLWQWNLFFSLLFLTLNLLCFWLSWSNLAWVSPPQSNICQTLQILIAKNKVNVRFVLNTVYIHSGVSLSIKICFSNLI